MEKPRYDVFLSHATLDKPVVEELARRLKKAGFEPWLDKWNLIPGEPWQEAIEQALEDCAACAVCIGPSGTGPWQNEEMRTAIDARVSDPSRAFRVIPVLLPHSERGEPSRLPAFLRATTWVEFRDTLDDEKALHRLLSGIRGLAPGADPGEAVAEGACPYRGLQVFDVADSLFFFGREALTEWLLDKLRTDRSGNRFLAIVGPSGSGKSSLARAGLVAALKQGQIPGSDAWPAVICKPGAQPLESLAIALAGAARLGDSPSAVLNLIRDLGANPSLLHLTTRLSLREAPADRRLVVLVDQFEEVFTLCPDEAQRQAIIANLLYAATAADGQTVVVLTLRADFYGRCAAYPDLATAVSDRQSLVGAMARDELRSAIERPAYLAGCELEGGLTDLLLNEVESQPNSLPLLEHALLQIWQRREGGRRLTIAAYREIGGVAGALEKHAEEVYSGFTDEEKEACRQIFLRLVQVDEQGRATKRRLGLEELPGEGVVSRLTNARLLTTDQEKQPTVELAHEALLANWARLKQWIEQDREALRTRRRLDEAVAEWIGKDRDSSFLLEGGRLAQAEEWAAGHEGEMGQEARDFLAASVDARDRERGRQRKLTIAAVVIAAVAILAAITALHSRNAAEKQRRIAVAGELSERSRTVLASNPQLGLLLAAQALKMAQAADEQYLPSAQSALRSALAESGGVPLPTGPVESIFVTPNHRSLVTLGQDRHVRLWNLGDNLPHPPSRDLGELQSSSVNLVESSSGDWLLIVTNKGSLLLDLRTPGRNVSKADFFKEEDYPRGSEAFSVDGRWLVTRKEERLLLRNLRDIKHSTPLVLRGQGFENYHFSPDSSVLVARSKDGKIEFWDLRKPTFPSITTNAPKSPFSIAFSPDSQIAIAITQGSGTPEVLSIRRKGVLEQGELTGCDGLVEILPHPSEIYLLCGSKTGRSKMWSYKPGLGFTQAAEWPFLVDAIDFSVDGHWLAITDWDGNVYLQSTAELMGYPRKVATRLVPGGGALFLYSNRWLLLYGKSEAPRFVDLTKLQDVPAEKKKEDIYLIRSARITAKGDVLRKSRASDRLRLQRLTGGPTSQDFPESSNTSPPLAVSQDGRWAAGMQKGKGLMLWRIKLDASVDPPILLTSDPMETLSFSPGGRWFGANDFSGGCRLWDLRSPRALPHFLTNVLGPATWAFSPTDDVVATAGLFGEIHLRILGENGPKKADSPSRLEVSNSPPALAYSPDGKWIAIAGGNDRIQIWKTSGREKFLDNRGGAVSSFVFSPDGHWLAAGGLEGTIQLWRWAGMDTVLAPILLARNPKSVDSIMFTPEGLMAAFSDGSERLWELRTDRLFKLACESAGRTLSKQEWNTYLPSEPYEPDEPCPGMPKAPD